MNATNTILIKSFVKPFYRQHAALFVFLFIALYGAVGVVDGAGLLAFHYSLLRGILLNFLVFIPVLILWILYARKCALFVFALLRKPEYSFFHVMNTLDEKRCRRMLALIQCLLFLPVILYAVAMIITGFFVHAYLIPLFTIVSILLICTISILQYRSVLRYPAAAVKKNTTVLPQSPGPAYYYAILLRYLFLHKKWLIAGIKIFSCGILYGMVIHETKIEYDLSMICLFFSVGILGHGLIIHHVRELEETRLSFYRSLPISVIRRWMQHLVLYGILLIPEFLVLLYLSREYLHPSDAAMIFLFCYSVVLLLNSLLFTYPFTRKGYLKIIFGFFFLIYISVLTKTLWPFSAILLLLSFFLFVKRYYRYEKPNEDD